MALLSTASHAIWKNQKSSNACSTQPHLEFCWLLGVPGTIGGKRIVVKKRRQVVNATPDLVLHPQLFRRRHFSTHKDEDERCRFSDGR